MSPPDTVSDATGVEATDPAHYRRPCDDCGANAALETMCVYPRRCSTCSKKPRVTVQRGRYRHPSDDCMCWVCKANDRGDNRSLYTGEMDR